MTEVVKAPSTAVQMTDGRTVHFPAKWKAIKRSEVLESGDIRVSIDFVNGEAKQYVVPASLTHQAACHGAENAFSLSFNGITDVEDMIAACDQKAKNLANGDWRSRVDAGQFAGMSGLYRLVGKVLTEAYPAKTPADIKAFLEGKDIVALRALRKVSTLQPLFAKHDSKAKLAKAEAKGAAVLAGFGA